jgi:pentatricopeptide repeat protein
MESIVAPSNGENIAWDVVASAVNPAGEQFKFSTSTLNFAIKELGERDSFDRAHALYLWMARKGGRFNPNEFTYVSLAGAARTLSQTRTVQTLWRRGVETNDSELICNEVASAVIAALNRVKDWNGAYQVFKDMATLGKQRNLYTYTAVLTALRDEAKADEALAVLNEMAAESGVQPTSLAFSLTLNAFDNSRRWIEGNALAMRIKKYDVRPDSTLMHAIITMAGRAGDMAHANDVFNAMRNSTMIVSTYTFNALLGGYARYGDWEGCIEVYEEMKRTKLQPDSYTFTQLISAAERSGEYLSADGVWSDMLRKRIIPHTVMCGAYIHCLGCQGRDLEAESIMEQMRDVWDVPRNAAVYNALIGAHVRSGEITRALTVLDDMQRLDGLMPTEITFAVLIRACQDSALLKRAEGLEQMRDALENAGQLIQDLSGAATTA